MAAGHAAPPGPLVCLVAPVLLDRAGMTRHTRTWRSDATPLTRMSPARPPLDTPDTARRRPVGTALRVVSAEAVRASPQSPPRTSRPAYPLSWRMAYARCLCPVPARARPWRPRVEPYHDPRVGPGQTGSHPTNSSETDLSPGAVLHSGCDTRSRAKPRQRPTSARRLSISIASAPCGRQPAPARRRPPHHAVRHRRARHPIRMSKERDMKRLRQDSERT